VILTAQESKINHAGIRRRKMANENLLIANFHNTEIAGSVKSSQTGAQTPVKAGPQSFTLVSAEAFNAPLPWTVEVRGENTAAQLSVTTLPAIAGFGRFNPSGTPGFGYLTAVVYPAR
jgi:hypothetical protein